MKNSLFVNIISFIVLIMSILVMLLHSPKCINKNDRNSNNITDVMFYTHIIEENKWITIPTYDGSNEVTHPKVLYFENGYNGYKYWMVSTPYPNNAAYYENPSITVSNDGINFIEPSGIKNPVSGYADSKWRGTYYSDPYILYDDGNIELFYRKTSNNNQKNSLYYQKSLDGINYSDKIKIIEDNKTERFMSVSVLKDKDIYKYWYVNYNGVVKYMESDMDFNFSNNKVVHIKDFDKKVWHGEVQYIDGKYICIFMVKYDLYYTESLDGIEFDTPKLINTKLSELDGVVNNIYKTTYVLNNRYIELYIPYRVNYVWEMYYRKLDINDFNNEINKNSVYDMNPVSWTK